MDLDNIECVSSSDGMEDEEIHHNPHNNPHQFSSKPHSNNGNNTGVLPGITPATSVHELLECPVCTNSMYPPIHQVLEMKSSSVSWFVFSFCGIWVKKLLATEAQEAPISIRIICNESSFLVGPLSELCSGS